MDPRSLEKVRGMSPQADNESCRKGPTTRDGRDSFFRCNSLEREQSPEPFVKRSLARVIEKTVRERLELFG
jgi:hypothetical protein